MNLIKLTETIKRIESLLALALGKAGKGAAAATVMANSRASSAAAPIGPAATVQFVTAAFVLTPAALGGVGHVEVTATCSVTGTGGTTVAGESLQFTLLLDGAPISANTSVSQETSATHNLCSATCVAKILGLVPGSSHTFGIQVTNNTTAGHTTIISTATCEINEWL